MKIYEVSYTTSIPCYGDCNTTKYVKANSEKEALKIANSLIHDNKDEIRIINELKTIN